MDRDTLLAVLKSHGKFLAGQEEGARADLREANLHEADLRGADLRGANLREANLREADLYGADLRGANLYGADLRGANLCVANLYGANLREANLREANLYGANLRGADLRGADLREADLREADLREANLCGADLSGTVLDPNLQPNGDVAGFAAAGGYVVGYRTRIAGHIDQYRDGRFYSADWFSVCEETECHPGLYLWPTRQQARDFSGNVEFIRVRTKVGEVHHAGSKWRCRWFEVLGAAE